MSRSGCIVVALLAGVHGLSAQTLRGRAVQPDSVGIPGVVVLLIDAGGAVAARALTNAQGEYRVRAPAPGSFQVRTMRIGFRPVVLPAVNLADGSDVEMRLELPGVPFRLDTLRVAARSRCAPYEGSSTIASAWEQARAALNAADLTARDRLLHASVTRTRRTDYPRARDLAQESSDTLSGFTTRPWGSVPADSLRRIGYVYDRADGSTTFSAPDIETLLSESFLQDHCFRFASGDDPTLIGIAFEPARDRESIPEIAGTVWLDRASAELRRMDFRYVNLQKRRERVASGRTAAAGEIDFVRMKNGSWAISSWEIRVPVVRERTRMGATPYEDNAKELYVHALHSERGTLSVVRQGTDTLYAQGARRDP